MAYTKKTKKELIEEVEDFRSLAELAEGILNCVPANIALIDSSGKIIAVNASWRKFASDNDSPSKEHYLGTNYFRICEKAEGKDKNQALSALKGIKNVLTGQSLQFALEYPCHSEKEKRWFRLYVTPFAFKGEKCAVVMHINITDTVGPDIIPAEYELNDQAALEKDADTKNNALIVEGKKNEELISKINQETITRGSALLNAVPDLILLMNGQGVYLDSHIPEENASEFPITEFIGKNASDVVPHLVTKEVKLSFRNVLKTGKRFIMEFPLAVEGKLYFYELRAAKCDDDKLLLLIRNITGKKKDEEEIHKLSLAIEQSPVIVLITNKKGSIEYVNPRFTEVTGYTFDEVLGKNPRLIKSGLTPKSQYKELWGRLIKGEQWKGEFCNRKKNGELFWELASIFPLKNSLGEVTQFVAVKEDITERKQTELRLAEYRDQLEQIVEQRTESLKKVNQLLNIQIEKQKTAEERIQNQLNFLLTLINTISNPLLIKDKTGRVLECNKSYEEYFGVSLTSIRGKISEDFAPEYILNKILEMEEELLKNPGQGYMTGEVSHINEEGKPTTLLINKAIFLESDNSIGGTLTIMIDISEQKKLQEKIEAALRKEQELNELKSSFISMASHEFRTPLTSILASADLLEMFGRQWKEEKYIEHIGKIQKGVEYMKELLDDVLIISRNEEGKTQFAPSKTNFLELCSELFDTARAASQGNHTFNFNYEPEQKLFIVDPKLVRHIISNLLSNAVKYSPMGGAVTLNVRAENNNLLVEVIDEGIGIPELDRERLFEPFYRAGNTNAIHGTGLGMSIVKRSVELHGGTISIETEENKGTTVHLSLPIKS